MKPYEDISYKDNKKIFKINNEIYDLMDKNYYIKYEDLIIIENLLIQKLEILYSNDIEPEYDSKTLNMIEILKTLYEQSSKYTYDDNVEQEKRYNEGKYIYIQLGTPFDLFQKLVSYTNNPLEDFMSAFEQCDFLTMSHIMKQEDVYDKLPGRDRIYPKLLVKLIKTFRQVTKPNRNKKKNVKSKETYTTPENFINNIENEKKNLEYIRKVVENASLEDIVKSLTIKR